MNGTAERMPLGDMDEEVIRQRKILRRMRRHKAEVAEQRSLGTWNPISDKVWGWARAHYRGRVQPW